MPLEIPNHIRWSLAFPESYTGDSEALIFSQSLFSSDEDNGEEDPILDILQEVYYVVQLDNIENEKAPLEVHLIAAPNNEDCNNRLNILNKRDECWMLFSSLFFDFLHNIYRKYKLLTDDANYDKPEDFLTLPGFRYKSHIQKMGEVYQTRYEVFSKVKNFLPWSWRRKHNLTRCWEIVCDGRIFQRFFNLSLLWLEETQRNLQSFDGKELEDFLIDFSNDNLLGQFKDRYIKGKGCFSKTLVCNKNNTYIDILCFSYAVEPSNEKLKQDIQNIIKCKHFCNGIEAKLSGNIRFNLPGNRFITLAEAIISGLYNPHTEGRMFSCCERKTFAWYDLRNCLAFRMVVKKAPCEFCQEEVDKHVNGFNKTIAWNRPLIPMKESQREDFESLGEKIYQLMHPLLLPKYP